MSARDDMLFHPDSPRMRDAIWNQEPKERAPMKAESMPTPPVPPKPDATWLGVYLPSGALHSLHKTHNAAAVAIAMNNLAGAYVVPVTITPRNEEPSNE